MSAYSQTLQQWLAARGTSPALALVAVMAADPEILTPDEDHAPEAAARAAARQAVRMGRIQPGQAGAAAIAAVALIAQWGCERTEIPVPADIAGCPDAVEAYRYVADGLRAADGTVTEVSRAKSVLAHLRHEAARFGELLVTAPTVAQSYVDEDGEDGVRYLRSEAGWEQYRAAEAGYLARNASALRWAEGVIAEDRAPAVAIADAWAVETAAMPLPERIQAASRLAPEVRRVLIVDRRLPKAVRRACANKTDNTTPVQNNRVFELSSDEGYEVFD